MNNFCLFCGRSGCEFALSTPKVNTGVQFDFEHRGFSKKFEIRAVVKIRRPRTKMVTKVKFFYFENRNLF